MEESASSIVALFDKSVASCRAAFASKTDAELMAPWTFKRDGKPLFTMPRVAMIRSMLLNHMVHRRGQLQPRVWERLTDEQ